ncbi:DUF11 domain-containing protein, partial [Flavobacterium zepuense]
MRKLLLTLFLLLGLLGAHAQSDVVVFNNNPNMNYVAGETLTFTVMITNNGPDPAINVNINYPIPAGIPMPVGITKFWWTGSNGSSGTNVAVNNTIATLGVNQTVSYTINIKIPDDYTATLNQPTVTYKTQSDIQVVTTDNQPTYVAGSTVVYTVTVTNNGPEAATNVQVNNAIPAGITTYSWTGNNASGSTALANTIATLGVGQTVTYTVTIVVPATFTGNLVNTISYVANVTDPTPACTQCTDTDVPDAGANLVIITTDNQTTYTAGGNAVYTVTVTNNGPEAAAAVNVSVPVPAGTTMTWTGSNSSSGTGALSDAVGSLADGASVTYTITVAVPAAYTGALTLTASATSTTADPDTTCTQCSDTDYDASSANIVTTKTLESGTTYTAGTNAIYTITVTNNGPTAAQNVVVSDVVPAGLPAAQATWIGSNGTSGTGNLNDVIALMQNGATVTYTFTIPIPSGYDQTASITNTVNVTSDTPDPVPACTTCTVTATPNPLANIVTLKTNGQTSYLANSQTTYTITVTNPGPSDAYNVVVQDNKPYYIDVMSWSGNGTGGSGSFSNTIPVLAAGESVIYTVQIFIPDDYASFVGTLTNTAVVTSSTPDPVPACPGCVDSDTARGNFVTTSNTEYTVPELVEDVLIDVNCVGIDNVTWSTGSNFGSHNGIAYFHRNNSAFPIQEGVVLTCGNAVPSPGNPGVDGPNIETLSDGSWPGDPEIQTYVPGINNDASWIKFNFVPVSDSFSFNYLFASEEYGTPSFECTYTDVFAFILTDLTNGTSTPVNLAVLPIPGNITVGVTTVHLGGAGCAPANPTYFGQYNTFAAAATAPINFNGQTVVMQASATVEPNHTYSIKLTIANGIDGALNSAVFIEGGSFDIGQPQLPPDITLGNEALLLCYGDTYDIEATITNTDMLVKWQKNGEEWIYDEDGEFYDEPTLTISEPGTYTIMGYFESNPDCFISDDIVIDFYPEIIVAEPLDLTVCGSGTTGVFNLRENDENILMNGQTTDSFATSYHLTEADAIDGFPFITTPLAYTAANNTEIFIRIEDYNTGCFIVKSFTLFVNPAPQAGTPNDLFACDTDNNGTEVFDLTTQDGLVLGNQDPTQYVVAYFTSPDAAEDNVDAIAAPDAFAATTQIIYVRLTNVDDVNCYSVTDFQITVTPQPVLEEVEDVQACDSYVLPELQVGNYYTEADGEGNLLDAGTSITQSQTIYIFAQEGTAPNTCTAQTSFTVTIVDTPVVEQPDDVVACEGYALPVLTVGNYYTQSGGNGTQLFAEEIITESQTVYIYASNGDENFSCSDEKFFSITIDTPPVVGTASPLEACDGVPNDFTAPFNLTLAGNEVIGGQTGLTVTYHTTLIGATNGTGAIPAAQLTAYNSESTPVTPVEEPLYIRVVATGNTTNCATVVPLQLIVHETPVIPVIEDYV